MQVLYLVGKLKLLGIKLFDYVILACKLIENKKYWNSFNR